MANKGRWVRLYTRMLWDSKIRELTCTRKWIFVTLLLLGDQNSGKILGTDAESSHISLAAGTKQKIVEESLLIFAEKRLISRLKNGIKICNWRKYQSTTARRDGYRSVQNPALEEEVEREDKNREDKRKKTAALILTKEQNLALTILMEVEGFDNWVNIANQLVKLSEEFPSVDPVDEARAMADWIRDQKRVIKNPSLFMRNWYGKAVEFGRGAAVKAEKKLEPEKRPWPKAPPDTITEADKEVWRSVLATVKKTVEPKEFDTWFLATRIVERTDSEVCIGVPNGFYKDFIIENYLGVIKTALVAAGMPESVKVYVREEG